MERAEPMAASSWQSSSAAPAADAPAADPEHPAAGPPRFGRGGRGGPGAAGDRRQSTPRAWRPGERPRVEHFEAFANFDPNEFVAAKVLRLKPFGIFVKLAPRVDGFVPVSFMAEAFVSRPEEIVSEGDEIKVRIIEVDLEGLKVKCDMRPVSAASNADRKKPGRAGKGVRRESLERIGKIVGEDEWLEGEVVRVEDYGIFVNVAPGVDGLV